MGIISDYGFLSFGKEGWDKRIKLVSQDDGRITLDIRYWSPGNGTNNDHGKGISLSKEEAIKVSDAIKTVLSENGFDTGKL
jgi:hypothetical protein